MHSFLEKPISCSVTRLMTCFVKGKVFFRIQRFSLLEVNFCGSVHFLEILRKLGTWNRNFRYIWFMEAKMMHDILWPLSRLSHFYIPVFQSFCGVFLLPFAINFFLFFSPTRLSIYFYIYFIFIKNRSEIWTAPETHLPGQLYGFEKNINKMFQK